MLLKKSVQGDFLQSNILLKKFRKGVPQKKKKVKLLKSC